MTNDIKVYTHSQWSKWKEAPGFILHVSRISVYSREISRIQGMLMNNEVVSAYLALGRLWEIIAMDSDKAWRIDGKDAIKELTDD